MSNIYGAPNGVERRAYRSTNQTLNTIPAVGAPAPTSGKTGDPLKQISNRARFVEVLEGQIELSLSNRYPLCLALVDFDIEGPVPKDPQAVLYAVAKLFSLNLRPTDILVRYNHATLAIILHECNEQGTQVVAQRLSSKIASGLQVGPEVVRLKPEFGFASKIAKLSDRADKLLTAAEMALKKTQTV